MSPRSRRLRPRSARPPHRRGAPPACLAAQRRARAGRSASPAAIRATPCSDQPAPRVVIGLGQQRRQRHVTVRVAIEGSRSAKASLHRPRDGPGPGAGSIPACRAPPAAQLCSSTGPGSTARLHRGRHSPRSPAARQGASSRPCPRRSAVRHGRAPLLSTPPRGRNDRRPRRRSLIPGIPRRLELRRHRRHPRSPLAQHADRSRQRRVANSEPVLRHFAARQEYRSRSRPVLLEQLLDRGYGVTTPARHGSARA